MEEQTWVLEDHLQKHSKLMDTYLWLIDSFLAEFFVEDLWKKLPSSWQRSLQKLTIDEFHELISPDKKERRHGILLPLSLQSFIASCHCLALPRRKQLQDTEDISTDKPLPHSFRKHVKLKKQYEVVHLSQDVGGGLGHLSRYLAFIHKLKVVTIESEGHHKITAEKFDKEALNDIQKLKQKNKLDPLDFTDSPPVHVTKMVPLDIKPEEFTRLVLSANDEISTSNPVLLHSNSSCHRHTSAGHDKTFMLVGLHTCGDLSPTMLRTFVNCEGAKGIILVSCCYMKLTCENVEESSSWKGLAFDGCSCKEKMSLEYHAPREMESHVKDKVFFQNEDSNSIVRYRVASKDYVVYAEKTPCYCDAKLNVKQVSAASEKSWAQPNTLGRNGFPMSSFLRRLNYHAVGWDAFELGCHNLDNYCRRLAEDKEKLKIQCYRAVLEVIIRKLRPDLKNPQIRCQKIKGASRMSFQEYASIALKRIHIKMPPPELLNELKIDSLLSRWKDVIMFYCLRLLLGPVIESMILVDRLLYLRESGYAADLCPVFDSKVSPRNFALIAKKSGC